MLTYAIVVGLERLCVPVLFKEISLDLNLSVVSVGTIWGMDPLAGVIIAIPGGLLVDRFGVRRTLTVICILAGALGALRGLSQDFLSMAVSMFAFGLTVAIIPSIVPKVTALWFSREKLGLANGLLQISWSTGSIIASMTSATIFSPLLGSWRNVLFLFGLPAIMMGILWLTTGKDAPESANQSTEPLSIPFKQAITKVIRIKDLWVIGFMQFMLMGALMGIIGYLSLYLKNSGWSTAAADSALTIINGAGLAGVIPMVYLADRLKFRKGILFFGFAIMATTLVLIPFMSGSGIYILLGMGAFLWSGGPPLFNALILETPGVGRTYGGTAMGLASSLGMVGAFVAPPLGNSLANIDSGMPFIFWGILAAAALPLFLLIRKPARESPGLVEKS